MRIQDSPAVHLTYCLNVHPGESWAENLEAIRTKAIGVRDRVSQGRPFGLGLRLSARAASELNEPERLQELRDFLHQENLYVFTINGFPYGTFHGTAVKEDVYKPDWRSSARREYTLILADILAGLLPEGVPGSISTVPCSYKSWITTPADLEAIGRNLEEAAHHLARLHETTGRDICLALEPEPDCFLETSQEVMTFFSQHVPQDSEACRRHLGICFDTAHAAVQFEDLTESLHAIHQAGIRIGKVQLSAALKLTPSAQNLKRLEPFCESVYLHQVKIRGADGAITALRDLPQALAEATPSPTSEWRVHFHVPLFCDQYQGLESTSSLMGPAFRKALSDCGVEQLEIETYTFHVLPDDLKACGVVESIVREFRWVLQG